MRDKTDAIVGCILGTAVGDALGLPYEGLTPSRARRMLGAPSRYRFLFAKGMISDDTEHTCMVAQSLIESGMDVELFGKCLARRLRWWLFALPAGVGKATAQAGIRLWLGRGPSKAGVFSAGNGPAMRAAIFGAAVDDVSLLLQLVQRSSYLTHTDPKAEYGAIAVALAAKHARESEVIDPRCWLDGVIDATKGDCDEWIELLQSAIASVERNESTVDFARQVGLERGVTGYVYHTVPIAIHAWLSSPDDYRKAVVAAIECGGDADTVAAIVGGIVGSRTGEKEIPGNWLNDLWEWPRSVKWMRHVGQTVAVGGEGQHRIQAPKVNPVSVVFRNVLFLLVVLFHGFRRLAPPYDRTLSHQSSN
ncbi:ADP-ribosylglycohydrolase family protein [Rhodopirellula sp. MGV]|uniref:ADP-ribosylglycohydrolase family protein n=1 Tax=Rhodopirellula sp. MGV TaxID=2023130 RepID=UPI001E2FD7CC|nr:ADP-ribosylglycohydrolase family protein [Rhodopirellula sp. MGV]